jgi:molecular chaperone DnaJ
MQPDHYEVLGVPPDADGAALRGAYLTLMRANHPDRRPGDAAAAALARRANAAYDVLGNPVRRAAYDRRRAGFPSTS